MAANQSQTLQAQQLPAARPLVVSATNPRYLTVGHERADQGPSA
jgi:hypothetical protein